MSHGENARCETGSLTQVDSARSVHPRQRSEHGEQLKQVDETTRRVALQHEHVERAGASAPRHGGDVAVEGLRADARVLGGGRLHRPPEARAPRRLRRLHAAQVVGHVPCAAARHEEHHLIQCTLVCTIVHTMPCRPSTQRAAPGLANQPGKLGAGRDLALEGLQMSAARLILRFGPPPGVLSTTASAGWIGIRLAMYAKRSEWHLVVKGLFAGQALPMITSWGGCTETEWSAVSRRDGWWDGRCGRRGR